MKFMASGLSGGCYQTTPRVNIWLRWSQAVESHSLIPETRSHQSLTLHPPKNLDGLWMSFWNL